MSTIGYQLNILRDTQMVQRRLLEKQFPYIEWDRMPFSSYGDFFRLRGILDDCGAVWTNAYGRSNTEADGQRNFLEDYSGNGRDIELFNFGYSKQSGYNGYVQDFRVWGSGLEATLLHQSENSITVKNNNTSTARYILSISSTIYTNNEWKVIVEADEDANVNLNYLDGAGTSIEYHQLHNGLNVINISEVSFNSVVIAANAGKTITLTQIAPYQGALVSDGVDDYGQCVKDFALPDDYTVVAMREQLGNNQTPLLAKSHSVGAGAFHFDATDAISYANNNTIIKPQLFSYQSKTSYNGTTIIAGSATDTVDDKLFLFKTREESTGYKEAALYSFGIFNRTLTADELRVVENCMYAEWIAMTGKLEDIEYYDILDARFRSNEESEDKRNRWVGRLGRLHMTLHNYAYSQMSGWDGYPINWESWNNVVIPQQGGLIEASKSIIKVKNFGAQPTWTITSNNKIASIQEMRIKISGLKTGASLFFIKQVSDTRTKLMTATRDGIYTVPADTSAPDYYAIYCNGYSANEDADLTIELIPDYGGALVSDGVDDYAVSDEVIDEPIGGVVAHAELLGGTYLFAYNLVQNSIWGYKYNEFLRIGDAAIDDNQVTATNVQSDRGVFAYSRTPALTTGNLFIARTANSSNPEPGQNALYQLRLIKNQPTDVQLEAIKWQCRKEHDDYLIHMGWKEVE